LDHNSGGLPFADNTVEKFLSLYCFSHFAQEFGAAKEPISFFIRFLCYFDFNVETGSVDNSHTKERLVIKRPDDGCMTILRHPMEATEEWTEKMGDEDWKEYGHIYIWE
jgi:hypothetical protein